MVAGAFPVAKLAVIIIKQISKPIANLAKERAKNHPFFRKYVCMPPAQFYNWCEVKTKMWAMNLGKPVKVPTLNEAMAIELGANLLGEGIIFIIAAGLLVLEYYRQSLKEEAKEAARVDQVTSLYHTINELAFQVEKQDAQLREVLRLISDLDTRVVKKPWHQIAAATGMQKPETKPETIIDNKESKSTPFEIEASAVLSQPLPKIQDVVNLDESTAEPNYIVLPPERLLEKSLHHSDTKIWTPPVSEVKGGVITQALKYLEIELYSRGF